MFPNRTLLSILRSAFIYSYSHSGKRGMDHAKMEMLVTAPLSAGELPCVSETKVSDRPYDYTMYG